MMVVMVATGLDIITEISTPNGWKTIFDMQMGDQLFSETGEIVNVVSVSNIIFDSCYKLMFSTGEEIIAGKDHHWVTSTKKDRKNANNRALYQLDRSIKTSKDIFETQKYLGCETNHSVSIANPVKYLTKELPIDPYTLGAWLGDGHHQEAHIECADPEILKEINKSYPTVLIPSSVGESKSCTYRIGDLKKVLTPDGNRKASEFVKQLQSLNLLKNKYIPPIYLRSNIEQRVSLLQGLMDTDGCCEKRDGRLEFCNTNKELAYAVLELVLSLGIKATIFQNESWLYDKQCKDRYRVAFKTDKPVFRLQRKLTNQKKNTPRNIFRYITKVEPTIITPIKSITIDNNCPYLVTRSFISTHNKDYYDR
jgi:hypothetical protein